MVKGRMKHELELRVVMAAMSLYETEQALERGFPGATCGGPQRYYMAECLRHRKELTKACETLKREKPGQWDADFAEKLRRASTTAKGAR